MKSSLLSLAALVPFASAAFYDNPEDVPSLQVDYVVVGGGAAGNVVANRLTEDENVSVLVIEAGVTNQGVEELAIPNRCLVVTPNTPWDWNYTTTPQEGLNGQVRSVPRGKVIGGSSGVNCMVYTRGSSDTYDRIAEIAGDDGWNWNNVQEYIRRNERFIPSSTGRNETGEYEPDVHGFEGVNPVSLPGDRHVLDDVSVAASRELGGEFVYNVDMNSGDMIGLGWTQSTIDNGTRSSSAVSYLADEYISRPNLNVLLQAQVTRILQTESNSSSPAFRSVEFTVDGGQSFLIANASREVIMAAGSLGTPNILLHSGIGPADELTAVGIPSLVDIPDVGKNLTEHPTVHLSWKFNSTDTGETLTNNPDIAQAALDQWRANGTGFLSTSPINNIVWLRIPENASIWNDYEDPTPGPNTPHNEIYIWNGAPFDVLPDDGNYITFGIAVSTALSRGSLTINSTNPVDFPLIDIGFLTNQYDVESAKEGLLAARRLAASSSFSEYILDPVQDLTEDQFEDYIRQTAGGAYHPVSTAAMTPEDAGWGVVNPDLRIKGVEGVRIVDASIIQFVPATHTMATVYVLAERAADIIKAAQ